MTNALQVFKNAEFGEIRTIQQGEEILFVAADVCKALDIKDTSKATSRLDEDEKGTALIRTPGGEQNMNTINEYGLYNLVLASRKPEAKAFKRWITHEVIPAIRKNGKYSSSLPAETEKAGLKYYNGVAVVTKKELAAALGTMASALQYYIKKENLLTEGKDYFVIGGQELRQFKTKYKMNRLCTTLTLITESGARKIYEYMQKEYCPVLFNGAAVQDESRLYADIPGCEEIQKEIQKAKNLVVAFEETLNIYNSYNYKDIAEAMGKTLVRQTMQLYVLISEMRKCKYGFLNEIPM